LVDGGGRNNRNNSRNYCETFSLLFFLFLNFFFSKGAFSLFLFRAVVAVAVVVAVVAPATCNTTAG